MRHTKAKRAKALEVVADRVRAFLNDLREVGLLEEKAAYRSQVVRLPRRLKARVNRAEADFDVYFAELEALALDLDCAASDAD